MAQSEVRARPQAPARRESRRETWHRPVPGPQLEDPAARSRAAPPQVRPAEIARGTGDLSRQGVKSPGWYRETSPKRPGTPNPLSVAGFSNVPRKSGWATYGLSGDAKIMHEIRPDGQ